MSNIRSIINKYGKPNIFINAKCNETWPEIIQQLLPGQQTHHRQYIIIKALKDRLQLLITNLRRRVYFGGNIVEYIFYWIDFPSGKLPSVGIAVKFINVHIRTIEESINFVDLYLKAENPSLYDTRDEFMDMSIAEYKIYRRLVNNFMIHKCCQSKCKTDKNNICKKGCNPNVIVPKTYINEKGVMMYRRRRLSDAYVDPHNPQALLDWEGHVSVLFIPAAIELLDMYKLFSKSEAKPVVFIVNNY